MHTELVESRVLAARDRAEQAHAFNLLNEQRVGEHEHRVAERRAEVSGLRVSELEHEISYLRGELDSTTVAWRSSQQEGRRRALGG